MSIRRNVIAYLALFIALGGTSYAAIKIPAGSVGARQLKNGAVTDKKVRAHSLTAKALAPGTLPGGLHTDVVHSPFAPVPCGGPPGCPVGDTTTVTVKCPTGQSVVGGGYHLDDGGGTEEATASTPTPDGTGWSVEIELTKYAGGTFGGGEAYAVCASTG